MPARSAAPVAAADDPYAAQRASFAAQERASGGFDLGPDDDTVAWRTPSSGRSWLKSGLVAYLLWLFVGIVAAHRIYLGRYFSAALQSVVGLIGFCALVMAPHNIGTWGPVMLAYGTWRLVDLFLIPGMCRTPPTGW